MQFVSAGRGWAVGQDAILATSDGGARWGTQLSGQLNLTSVDFISGQDGWAVGATTLLATTDGGTHWAKLPEPCPVIRSVHFVSPSTGYAVAGGSDASASAVGPAIPELGGMLLATGNGGRSWHALAAPADAQTVCFTDPEHGWLGAAGMLSWTADGGKVWTTLPATGGAAPTPAGDPALMSVECANGGAWAVRAGPGAGMSQQQHAGYHANEKGATAIFAEQYFQTPGTGPSRSAPGSDPGPFSVIDSSAAAFIDACTACGAGTAPWDLATRSGAALTPEGNVGLLTSPQAASFVSGQAGWVAGQATEYDAGKSRGQQRIVATADGGRTWHIQYAGPWSAWAG
jgi:hypothetical protein